MRYLTMAGALGLAALTGCATVPREQPITISLTGTSTEVQSFIEDKVKSTANNPFEVYSADDRSIVFKADCMSVLDMNAFSCAVIMMTVGNSGWDGPHLMMSFRTTSYKGIVKVSGTSNWCATNAFNKTNCGFALGTTNMNSFLRTIEASYNQR